MHLEHALNEDDEYIRLQKLSIAIKEITQILPNQKQFKDISTLKLLICAYPFQQHSVELLISILFDRFKDGQFISAFHQACSEVAQLQEQRALLSQRSLSLKSSRLTNMQNTSLDSRKSSQNVSFAKAVIEKLLIAKKFSTRYLKQLFLQANELKMDLEKMARIFKILIINTKDQEFRLKIISIFDECKNDIFGNRQWVATYYEEIDQFFLQNHVQSPSKLPDFIQEKNSKITFQVIDDPLNYDSDDSQEESIDIQIQKWLFETNTYDVLEREDIFNKPENYDEILKYITQPEKVEVHKIWAKYSTVNMQNDDPTYYKLIGKSLKQEETIRSYKALQVLIKEDNFQFFDEFVKQNVIQIFNGVYEFVNDQNHNMNLNHIAKLIEVTLMRQPKLSVVQIVDLNLYFSLSLYIYNSMIAQILENIINIKIDYYQLGYFFQEQLWKYLCKTEWFKFIVSLVSKEGVNMNITDKHTKTEATISILSILKTLSQYDQKQINSSSINTEDKELLTNFLGVLQSGKTPELYYTTNQFNWQLNKEIYEYISANEFDNKDLDNLNQFIQERKNNSSIKQYFMELKNSKMRKSYIPPQIEIIEQEQIILTKSIESPAPTRSTRTKNNIIISTRKSQSKGISKLTQSNSLQSSPTQLVESPYLESHAQTQVQDSIEETYSTSFKRQQQKSIFLYHQSKFRHRTEGNFTNDGFSSSRLKTIYPSYKTSIKNTQYENQLEQLQIDYKYYQKGIRLMHEATKSILQYLKQNNDKVKSALSKLDISSMSKCFLSQNLFDRYFQIYMLNILENQPYDSNLSDECGVFINYIFENVLEIKSLADSQIDLCNSFLNSIEYLCKIIFEMHKNPNFLISTKHKFKKTLLMTTLNTGLQLFQLTYSDQIEKLIIKYLNESVLHILVIWFFDSDSNNTFQRNFFMFLNLLLNQAHSALISTLFFKIGFIASLQNAYSRFYMNGIKNDSNYENLSYYIQIIIQLIQNVIHKRQLVQVEKNLETMQSWHIITGNKYIELTKSITNTNIVQDNMINLEKQSQNTPKYASFHRTEDRGKKERKVGEILIQKDRSTLSRKSLLLSPRLLPLSPALANKFNQQNS
ncbi:unnamed protein product [Paramecium octaurelia]|uniref:Uncharacterized protein n=1 Tax=Paramecium octaurelia TaxID=43137 RepID=A0A8S1SB51_PAROT|nr:unnamed protein product [Paramecium octaurelia]